MALALIDIGADVNIFERKGFLYDPAFPLPERLTARISGEFRDDTVFTFEHPGAYRYLQGRRKVGLLTYESTVVPPHWVEGVNKHLDLLLLPSRFCCDIFKSAGVPEEKMDLLPYGYDPDIYFPAPDSAKGNGDPYRFLTVASPHKREGIETVLAAYRAAFSRTDDVTLTVKVNYLPGAKTKPFEYAALKQMAADFNGDSHAPPVTLETDYLPPEKVADLYRASSCVVSATRGEGFGLVFLEAAACGIPLIVTGWSGHMDFVQNADTRLVKYTLRPAAEMQYDCQSQESLLADADTDDLARCMRAAYDARTTPRTPPDREWLKQYTWNHLAAVWAGRESARGTGFDAR